MQSHNIGYWYGHQLQNSAESQLGLERPDIPNESTTAIKSVLKLGQAPNVPAIAPGSIRRGPEAEDMSNQMARDDDECRRDFEHDMQLYGKPNLPPGRTPYVVQHASTSPVASTSSSIEVDIPCPYGTDVVNDPGLDKPYTLKVETIEREDGNVTRISSNVKPIIRKRLAEHAGTTSVEDSDAQPPVDNRRVGPNGPSGYNLRRGRNSMQFAHTYNRSDDVFGDDSVSNNSGSPDFQRALRDTQNRNQ